MSEENKNTSDFPEKEEPIEESVAKEMPAVAEEPAEVAFEVIFEEEELPKEPRKVSLMGAILAIVSFVLAAVMLTYTCCNVVYKRRLAEAKLDQVVTGNDRYYGFDLFNYIFSQLSLEETNEEEMMAAALKAYVQATGDRYAAYYTAEEYQALMNTTAGKSEGIGINIINTTVTVSGMEYQVIRVINVSKDSPAEHAGIRVGDLIYAVGDMKNDSENAKTVQALGYDIALKQLQGETGTEAVFTVLRPKDDGYEMLDAFHIVRSEITTTSVYSHRFAESDIGIVKIVQFDLTTPTQFCEAMTRLQALGCKRFVFDVRYNPGGDLRSIEAILSYFLSEGDVLIRTKDKSGEESVSKVEEVTYSGEYAGCSITKDDIGKYRGLDTVVLCNGSTASAAELFTATFRDYGLGKTVGVTTYGKGSMQSIIPLVYYGYSGALKLTTAMYFSAKDEVGYDGVGITPDIVIELSEEAANQGIYEIADEDDNQLMRAIQELKSYS